MVDVHVYADGDYGDVLVVKASADDGSEFREEFLPSLTNRFCTLYFSDGTEVRVFLHREGISRITVLPGTNMVDLDGVEDRVRFSLEITPEEYCSFPPELKE